MWGDVLPPPTGAANLAGEELRAAKLAGDAQPAPAVPEFRDEHAVVAPVESYGRTPTGLFGMGGNVSEWTHDVYVSLPDSADATDPMGATGSSINSALTHYKTRLEGVPKKCITMHLIVTPEYLRHVRTHHPDVIVYALRLDRGLSPTDVLACTPGERWDDERGLNEHHYIVPGGGGLGEVMNNSFV